MSHTTHSSTTPSAGAGGKTVRGSGSTESLPTQRESASGSHRYPDPIGYLIGAIRLSLGWVFLWAFMDKTFGLGHATENADSWLNGGSPSTGFLSFAAAGPFKGVYNDLAGQGWVDWLFMIGLLGIGAALILGVAMRAAAVAGVLMLVLMWTAVLPPENNVFMDDHLIYAMVLVLITLMHAGRWIGLGAWWERQPIVRRFGWLS